jgi:hypothetical protein
MRGGGGWWGGGCAKVGQGGASASSPELFFSQVTLCLFLALHSYHTVQRCGFSLCMAFKAQAAELACISISPRT